MPSTDGFTASHTSTNGVPVIRTWGWRRLEAMPRLLAALHQVIDQDPELSGRTGTELLDRRPQVVDAVQAFDHHALNA